MSSWCEPKGYVAGTARATGYELFLQDRVAAAFHAEPGWIEEPWARVRPRIFSGAEIDEMAGVPMRIGCLILNAGEWQPSVHIDSRGDLVFYRAEMSGLWETGRYREGKPVRLQGRRPRWGRTR